MIRSVSDAVEPSNKYLSMRRSNGFLRRPEILETVYSVEEDADDNNQERSESMENLEIEEKKDKNSKQGKGRLQDIYGSFERLTQDDLPSIERPKDENAGQQAQVSLFSIHSILGVNILFYFLCLINNKKFHSHR